MEALTRAFRGAGRKRPTRRSQGHVEKLDSGSYRIKVYAGIDAVLDRKLYLTDFVAAGPNAENIAEQKRYALVDRVATGNYDRTDASVPAIVDRYLAAIEEQPVSHRKLGRKTLDPYKGFARKHITPLLHKIRARDGLHPDMLDGFYGVLSQCRDHQQCKSEVRHWTQAVHNCDKQCTRHRCRPLQPATIRKIHFILRGAYLWTLRRKWLLTNPVLHAECPRHHHRTRCHPPPMRSPGSSPRRGAAPTTAPWCVDGMRHRRPARRALRAALVRPDHRPRRPWTHHRESRPSRLPRSWVHVRALHSARHYSVTELILAGIDIRTIAGRHGHAGGGMTTLKYYAAWVNEADQRAADVIIDRVPARPATACTSSNMRTKTRRTKAQTVAEKLRDQILDGHIAAGDSLPTMKQLAAREHVSINAAHAAANLLANDGYITVSRGKRATVTPAHRWPPDARQQPQTTADLEDTDHTTPEPAPPDDDLAPVVGLPRPRTPPAMDRLRTGTTPNATRHASARRAPLWSARRGRPAAQGSRPLPRRPPRERPCAD